MGLWGDSGAMEMTRAEALARLSGFVPRVARYGAARNFDFGPGRRENVSMLSPYVRHRLILEEEVVGAVLGCHAYPVVEKFVQEVAWRTYWKGWLEMRPAVWERYCAELEGIVVSDRCREVMAGRSGIACLDAWCRELVETGYLHNHARMWFASIWIFTLGLPWQVGADFFLRHLMDGDPASNTLSWRWVAGLHTKGKHYQARAENIARFTAGRFDPVGILNEIACPLPWEGDVEKEPLEWPEWSEPCGRVGHLMVADDLGPPPCDVHAAAVWHPERAEEMSPVVSPLVHAARCAAVEDAVERSGGVRLSGEFVVEVREWVAREKLDAVVMAYPTVGPWKSVVSRLCAEVPVRMFVRPWDRALWPYATAGFFRFKNQLPRVVGDALPQG